jgi:phage terminase small subunit
MTLQQTRFVKNKVVGMNNTDAAIAAGYSLRTAPSQASRLLKNVNITKALQRAGLTDNVLANTIKTNIEAGVGVKATADTATKNVELALRLKGYLNDKPDTQNLTQNNVYINELKQLNDKDLSSRLDDLTNEVQKLK